MGVSTNAVVFYGYCWNEEQELLEGHRDDEGNIPEWEEIILRRRGVTCPWDAYPPEIEEIADYDRRQRASEKWIAEHREEIDSWYAAKEAVGQEFDIELSGHCSGEYSMPYLAIPGAGTTGRRGHPESLPDLTVKPEWDGVLDRWLAEFGVEKPHEKPQWWLVS